VKGLKVVSIRTLLTEKFGLEYPIVSAPMGSVAGGRLAAAVSNAGALGLSAAVTATPTGCAPSSPQLGARQRVPGAWG
jgi:NAD(P)H-dependent flavin oxidoreductase YrpB (nitropropane dioxygenase family)